MGRRSSGETKRTTLKDIAEESGVSVSTVSAVLSGSATRRRISPDVMQRVQEVAAGRGFSPNRLVRSLQHGRTHILAFYSAFRNRWASDLYMDQLSKAVELAAGDFSYDILTLTPHERTPEETFAQINGGWSDGLVLFGVQPEDPLLPLLCRSKLPTVLLLGVTPEPDWLRVDDDESQGLSLLADEIVANNHRNVAVLIGRHRHDTGRRVEEFRRQMGVRGVDFPSENVIVTTEDTTDQGLHELLALPERPTVVFSWNDRLGYRFLEACDRAGISVPDELSVVGYDGIHWPSTSRHILTSVAVDFREMARAAVELLDQCIEGRATLSPERLVAVNLRHGTTLGPAPDSIASKNLPGILPGDKH